MCDLLLPREAHACVVGESAKITHLISRVHTLESVYTQLYPSDTRTKSSTKLVITALYSYGGLS